MKNVKVFLALITTVIIFVSCGETSEMQDLPDAKQLLINADSIAATIQSAECILYRSFKTKVDSGAVEYKIQVRKNPTDKFGFSYRITESAKAFAIYHDNEFMLVYPEFKMALVPDNSMNPVNAAETYKKVLAPIIKLSPQKDMITMVKNISFTGTEEFGGELCNVISVRDTTKDEIVSLDYFLGRETGLIKKLLSERIILADMSLRKDLIIIKDMKVNPVINDSIFLFKIPSEYKIQYIGGIKNSK
jgi:outer membrane lipoprotein-sorting protein